ncbi:outer membrane beta-barrel protein [Myroides odoratimimus]|uniref:outer membrane beta-barrel protein n=1 Tax=Myroides odoratimimus TaxID=76832 RepID=UPI000AC83AA6|nr:outer membrane beta-barrel protein [Myroides odoratimimus]
MGQYKITDNWRVAARAEYYADKDDVIINTGTTNGFQTWDYSVNVDYQITEAVNSKDAIFMRNDKEATGQTFIGSTISIKL